MARCLDQRFHVFQITIQRFATLAGYGEFGSGNSTFEGLFAADVTCALELSGVYAQVAVRCAEKGFEFRK